MSLRPTLSLKKNSLEPNSTYLSEDLIKPSVGHREFKEKAKIERIKRYNSALGILESMNIPFPLSKGTGKSVYSLLREQGVSCKAARWAMQSWTHSKVYLQSVIDGKCRYNLDGSEAELIRDRERDYSKSALRTQR